MASDLMLDYLYASISDIQSTIRALDTKVSYLLVILFIPLTKLPSIYNALRGLLTHSSQVLTIASILLSIAFSLSWIIGLWCALRTIIAIDDPRQHIDGDRPESQFYPAQLFDHGFWTAMGFKRSESKKQFGIHYSSIPSDPDEIAKQLTLEQMKTMYIASLKLERSRNAYKYAVTWVMLGGVLWILNLICV